MKSKFVLCLLPALMALTSCGVKPVSTNNKMLEDTNAHAEIFGQSEIGGKLAIKNRASGEAISEPKIGYQISYSGTKIAIRFVAALKEFNVKAYWKRGVAAPDSSEGNSKSFANDAKESTNYYLSLSDGNTTIEAKKGDYADYAGFVVYTLYNIPYSDNKDSYIAAYVKLVGDEEGENVECYSKALAVKIEKKADNNYKSNNVFAFDPTVTGHFLEGTINGVLRDGSDNSTHSLVRGTEQGEGDNQVTYSDLSMKTTDSFGSFYYSPTIFQFFGYNSFVAGTADAFFEADTLSGYSKPKFEGVMTVNVSRTKFNKITASTALTVSVRFTCNKDAGYGNGVFIAGDMTNWKAVDSYRLSNDGNEWEGTFSIPIGSEVKYVVGPWNGGNPSAWESGNNHIVMHDATIINVQGW